MDNHKCKSCGSDDNVYTDCWYKEPLCFACWFKYCYLLRPAARRYEQPAHNGTVAGSIPAGPIK